MADSAWRDWIGRRETLNDTITAVPARAMAATLNHPSADNFVPGAEIPPVWTWLHFLPLAPMSNVGPDGHPRRGGFLPPVELPRRMWAGSRCTFHATVRIGDPVEKTSTILKVSEKTGSAGAMVFVTVGHEVRANGKLAMQEEQDIVYIGVPEKFSPPPPTPLPACDWQEPVAIDPVLLFRFSALTFNGHRIHYDLRYAVDVEHYPGLVVHGPLQAILLFDAAVRHAPAQARAAKFEFRGLRPLFDFDRVSLNGRASDQGGFDLYTANADNAVGMQARLQFDNA